MTPVPDPTLLRVEDVDKYYGRFQALDNVSLTVDRREALVILGPSGSGKSTLLRCIAQIVDVDGGRIYLDGELLGYQTTGAKAVRLPTRRVDAQRRETGMVFQNFNLFPHLTALENISTAPRHVLKQSKEEAETGAHELLKRVGLADKARSYPNELSGGQQQRVAIARAMAMRPKILLFDEPTSALDPEMIHEVLAIMEDLAHQGMTMVVVTHETGFAREAAKRVGFMEDGRLLEIAPTEQFFREPANPRAREFLQRIL